MASIKDVAQKAGVGVGTVSRVINGSGYVAADTRKKIEQAISDLEYTPNELARNLFRNRTGIIGVLIPDLDHPFFSSFARETEVALYKRGYKAMICNTVGSSNRERDYLNMLDRNMVDFGPEIPMVGSDHAYGGKLAAEIMLKNNCKRVVHITGIAPNVAANDRHIIFEETLKKHGVEVLDLTMEWNLFDHQSYWDAAAEAIEKYPDADGVFAADQPALCYMHLALRICYPEVTAICQNVKFLAETCAKSVINLIEDKEPVPHRQILSVELRQGQSTYPVEIDGKL